MKTKPKMLCKTCDGMVAASAKACPHCGERYSTGGTLLLKIGGVVTVMQGAWLLQFIAKEDGGPVRLFLLAMVGLVIPLVAGGFLMIAMAEKIRRRGMREEGSAVSEAPPAPVMRKPPARKRAF